MIHRVKNKDSDYIEHSKYGKTSQGINLNTVAVSLLLQCTACVEYRDKPKYLN